MNSLLRHPRAPSITALALKCCEMGPSETQTWPASTDARIWTRLLSEKIVKSLTNIHDATSLRNYYTLLKLQRNYRLLNYFKPIRKQVDSWMDRASAPTWAAQNGWLFNRLLQFALNDSLKGLWTIILAFLLHLFQYFCKRDWDLAGVNVIWLV